MRKLKDALRRFRNSRGFGVHSPYGYSITQLVTNLGNNYAYYAEREIRKLGKSLKESPEAIHHAIMLHRLAAMFKPGTTIYLNILPSKIQRMAINRAGCHIKSGEWRAESGEWRAESGEWRAESGEDSAYASSQGLDTDSNSDSNSDLSPYIIYSEDAERKALEILEKFESGIIIEGNECVVVIPREQTQPVIYKLNF